MKSLGMGEFKMSAAGSNDYLASKYEKKFIEGLKISVASTTTLSIASGSCRDSTNAQNIVVDSAKTLNFGVNGLNGLDTGSIGASKLYYVFAIADSLGGNPSGVIASLSSTPLLPTGANGNPYDIYRRIGWARSGGGSTLLTLYQSGEGNVRKYKYDTMIAVLSSGTSQTLAAIDLSSACPPIDNMNVLLHVQFTPATADDSVKFAPFGSTATVIPGISGVVAAKVQQAQIEVLSKLDTATPKVLYINSAASCDSDIWLYGFEDVL